MSEGSRQLVWRIVRLRFEHKLGIWRALGVRGDRTATILLPLRAPGESEDRWMDRIERAFERAAPLSSGIDPKRF
jgi:hypothetical protein